MSKAHLLTVALCLLACAGGGPDPADAAEPRQAPPARADVVRVQVRGRSGAYTFSVRVHSPDTGCDRYADWWEVVGQDGRLLYRRILLHSHVDEQPFTRSGGPVRVESDTRVWVRAHLSTGGYGAAMAGTASAGFALQVAPEGFAARLETQAPQPGGCAF